MKIFTTIIICTLSLLKLSGQSTKIFIPEEIQNAYSKQTRSLKGIPGPKYWQNSADYNIKTELIPVSNSIVGYANIKYYNNSPNDLKNIVIRLYQDLYKIGQSRTKNIDKKDVTSGVSIEKLSVNGEVLSFEGKKPQLQRRGTNMFINLPKPLKAGSSINISIEWNFKIPEKTQIRMGKYFPDSYFIGQWYPQVAAYDDIDGWDIFDYNASQEFYNDYGNFEVEITVPKGFCVWATGELQNSKEVLSSEFALKFEKANKSGKTMHLISENDYEKGSITKETEKLIWKFKANNVNDFSFATSNNYIWDAKTIRLASGKNVLINIVYNREFFNFHKMMGVSVKSIEYMSQHNPGIEYPYPVMTIFNGGGGMEYPMMVNMGRSEKWQEQVYTSSHEIAHTYFPFLVASNERKYAWMDESFAVYFPEEIQYILAPEKNIASYTTRVYSHYSGREMEPAIMLPSMYLTGTMYFLINYGKAEQTLRLLEDYLGEEKFREIIKKFIKSWEGKHPTGYDFFYFINEEADENLYWFWKPWYFERGYAELGIKDVKQSEGKWIIEVENNGYLPVPVYLKITCEDGEIIKHKEKMDVWKNGKTELKININTNKNIKKVELGNAEIPDKNNENNIKTLLK